MADKLHFNLVSPERQLISENVDQVDVPGAEGFFGVLPMHAPFMSTMSPGVVRVVKDGGERRFFVQGGFAEVTPDGLTILAEEAIPVEDLSADDIARSLRDAEEDFADADTDEKRHAAAKAIEHLKELQAAL